MSSPRLLLWTGTGYQILCFLGVSFTSLFVIIPIFLSSPSAAVSPRLFLLIVAARSVGAAGCSEHHLPYTHAHTLALNHLHFWSGDAWSFQNMVNCLIAETSDKAVLLMLSVSEMV